MQARPAGTWTQDAHRSAGVNEVTDDELGSLAHMDADELAVATLRTLSIDAVQKANSGHPGLPLGAAPMAHALLTRHLRYDSATPPGPTAIASS